MGGFVPCPVRFWSPARYIKDTMGSWDMIRLTLDGRRAAYDEAVVEYKGELGMI